MTGIYILVVIILNVTEKVPQVVEGINTAIGADLSNVAIFWIGLLVVFILDTLLGGS